MTKTQKSLTAAAILAVIGAGAVGTNAVFAAQHGPGHSGALSGIVNAIAQKFHLSPTDVQAVIDEQHQQMTEQMKKQMEERLASFLAQAVKDGKLTQAQADAVTAKMTELKTFEVSLEGKTPEERQSAMKTERDTLKQWAKDNNIPEQYLMFGRGIRGMKPGMPRWELKGEDMKARLDQAVKDGKLTQAQEDLIVAKQAEIKTFMESLKDKNATDRQSALKTEMDALKQWAKDNGIPEQFVNLARFGIQKGGAMGKDFHFMK